MPNSEYFWKFAKKTISYNYIYGLHNEESKLKGDKKVCKSLEESQNKKPIVLVMDKY